MLKRFKNLFDKNFEIEVYKCFVCKRLRTNLEWEVFKNANCPECGSNKIYPVELCLWEKIYLVIRYLIKGY